MIRRLRVFLSRKNILQRLRSPVDALTLVLGMSRVTANVKSAIKYAPNTFKFMTTSGIVVELLSQRGGEIPPSVGC